MHIIKVGLDYRDTPLEIRERLKFSDDEAERAMQALSGRYDVLENVIISTCNRTEIFAVVDQNRIGRASVQQFLLDWFQLDENQVVPYIHYQENDDAIKHLYKLAVGLDSMVLGETQIIGQVRDAFFMSQRIKSAGKIFNELFKRVITFAKRAHSETAISEQAVSTSYVAVELSKKIFGNIDDKQIVIIGAGDMGKLTLKNLQGSGVQRITVVNRTLEKAEKLATQFNANAVHMGQLLHVLKDADILISSTTAEEIILNKQSLQSLQEQRQANPLCIIDIAVPRDIDRSVGDLNNVFLYDIDDLHGIVDQNLKARKQSAFIIETQLVAELSAFNNWVSMLDAVPMIKALREKSLSIQDRTFKSIQRKIPDLTERESKVLQKHMKSIVHQLLEEPIKRAKKMGENQEDKKNMALFKEIFGLNPRNEQKASTLESLMIGRINEEIFNLPDSEYTYK